MLLPSEDHSIVPGPNRELEGPLAPEKLVHDPDGPGIRRMSRPSSVLKEVAVSVAPMARSFGVMEQNSLLP